MAHFKLKTFDKSVIGVSLRKMRIPGQAERHSGVKVNRIPG